MKSRIGAIVGGGADDMWVGTFHSVCVRILRSCIDRAGYGKDFVIYDSADSRTVIKECIKEAGFDEKSMPARSVISAISKAKNECMLPDDIYAMYGKNPRMRAVAEIYELYRKKLINNNALDFDDLIFVTLSILTDNEDVAEKYKAQFRYILVDEYQDTNNSQYRLVKLLSEGSGNICVVGDDDQSIYKFRGADIRNILGFEKDFKNSVRITLDRNYRSTSNILNAANAVISHNKERMGKELWTAKPGGEPIGVYYAYNDKDEARFVADRIKKRREKDGRYSDCAVLYRMNSQSRAIEEALMREDIPYKVLAGLRFYDRKEIKDMIAYLRLIYNHGDNVSLRRIINEPKRKIGAATLEKLRVHAIEEGSSEFEVAENAQLYPDLRSAAPRLERFVRIIRDLRQLATIEPVDVLVRHVAEDSGYMAALEAENDTQARTREENIKEFISAAGEYTADPGYSGTLAEFLETVTLVSDTDSYDENEDCAVLMTIHSAKGLEFPEVFLVGLEDGVFPSERALEGGAGEVEEERRLCYVAITRAKEKLYITSAAERMVYGSYIPRKRSRFLKEVPEEYTEEINGGIRTKKARLDEKLYNIGIRKEVKWRPERDKEVMPAIGTAVLGAGMRVKHRKFGAGTIVTAKPTGNDVFLTVDFDAAGTKRMLAAFAKLEVI